MCGGLLPKEGAWMDKEGEQPPAGGIDLRGRLTVMRSLPFVQQEQRAAWREPFKPSQSTHSKTSLGLQPHNSLKGASLFYAWERRRWCHRHCGVVGSPNWASWSVLEGTFKNLNQGAKQRQAGGGGWVDCLCPNGCHRWSQQVSGENAEGAHR